MADSTPRILLVTYGGGHGAIIASLYHELERRGEVHLSALALTTGGAALHAQGIPSLGFRDFVLSEDEPALKLGRTLMREPAHPSIPERESEAYLGLSMQDLIARHGAAEAERLYTAQGRQAFLPLGMMERVFDRLRPDLVIATNSPRAEAAAILTARKRGVPALCVVDLFGGFDTTFLKEAGYADRVCVPSEGARRILIEAGRRPEEIAVTGNPAFDELANPGIRAEAARLRAERGWEGMRVVLWASQPTPSDPERPRRVDRALIEAARSRPNWRVAIRPHPSERLEEGLYPPEVHWSGPNEPLAPLLAAVDAVVIANSTVGLQAALLGTPVLTLREGLAPGGVPYAEEGIALPVETLEELAPRLERLFREGTPLRPMLPDPGGAAARVADEALALLSRSG